MVEGITDLYSIVGLLMQHTQWPQSVDKAPVHIHNMGGVEKILNASELKVFFKTTGMERLGIVLDADANPLNRYSDLRRLCLNHLPGLPAELPAEGLIHTENNIRFGVWLMPDNRNPGSLETFLSSLIPLESKPLWGHALSATETAARKHAAPFIAPHRTKAEIFSWLAWQNEPGQNPGVSLKSGALNAHSPSATAFVQWFLALYAL